MKMQHLKILACSSLMVAWPIMAASTSPFGEPIQDFGGATLLTPRWLSVEDYPNVALEGKVQGRVVVGFEINAKGKVENCTVKSSSGSKSLDVVPCRLLQRKARFALPTNDVGVLQTARGVVSVDFWLPK